MVSEWSTVALSHRAGSDLLIQEIGFLKISGDDNSIANIISLSSERQLLHRIWLTAP
jgi:hypothetical protein